MKPLSVCGLFAAILLFSFAQADDKPGSDEPKSPPEVSVSLPITREILDYEEFAGRAEAVEAVYIHARVTGPLEKVFFKEGAIVQRGDILYQIDPRRYQGELDRIEAEIKVAEARLKQRMADLERMKKLLAAAAIAREDYERVQAAVPEAETVLLAAKAGRELARLELSFTRIAAPISGRIGRSQLSAGNLVKANETLLTTIVSTDPVFVYFDVDERTLLRVHDLARETKGRDGKPPATMGLAVDEGFPHAGAVDFIDNRVDSAKGTLVCRAVFPNPTGRIMPGMSARVRIPISSPYRASLVAETAVNTARGPKKASLIVVNEKNMVEHRVVELGQRLGDGLRVVQHGLKADERILVPWDGHYGEGQVVKPQLVPMPTTETPDQSRFSPAKKR